ncbi:phospholipase D-like domain-containing protein [Roseimaritima ulvae]|uniref:Putative cardiolipin synthase YwiE n=1 Tax=Roseimaritima ulvae TaxID=980254 RepID=A0A5B9R3M2_9BACT|nr:phospholipase D-like domain-containing protein [Roseimaritima ulvae]QEG40941.1 putative cardiolipin synthase YwiE [Roseimaritima ulvae]
MLYLYVYLSMLVGAISTLIAMTAMRRGETHNVGKFGWMLLILLTPPIGLVFFLWLGGRKISAEHQRRDLVRLPHCDPESRVDSTLAQIGVQLGLPPASRINKVELLISPEQIYRDLFELVGSATRRLFIHTFILVDDHLSKKLIDQLCQKADNGVDVRLMIDGFASATFPDEPLQRLRAAGAKTTRFKPLANLSRFAYLNFRNHRKIAVADGTRALLGGANLVEYEVTNEPDDDTWIDLSLRIEGTVAAQIEAVFLSDWMFTEGETQTERDASEDVEPSCDVDDQVAVQLIPVGPDGPPEILDDLWLTAISRASERVWIVTPYFVPPPVAQQMLMMAIRRGVDVRIIVPDVSDMKPADYARFDYFRELVDAGATLLRHPHRVVHAKGLLVDNEVAYVGSANFDFRSFFLNYELVVGIFSPDKIDEVAAWYEQLQQQCEAGIRGDTWRKRAMGTLFRMVAAEL